MKENVNIREVIVLPTLMHWRKEVIENVFGKTPSKELMAANRQYEEYLRHGIAHSIVHWLVHKARQLKCGKIWLETTEGARTLYSDIGFRELPGIMKYGDIQDSES